MMRLLRKRAPVIYHRRTTTDELRRWLSFARGGFPFALFAFRDFLAIDGDIAGRLDADANLRTVHRHHGYFHIVADAQTFTGAASEYQHEKAPMWFEVLLAHASSFPAVGVFLQIAVGLL
jgi:hypothetical protein